MQRRLIIWIVLIAIYGAFLTWHFSFKPPLTEEEVTAFIAGEDPEGAPEFASTEAFVSFLSEDNGRPFYMLNLIELRPEALYPEGYETDITSAEEADAAYGNQVVRLLFARGSYPLLRMAPHEVLIDSVGGAAASFDHAIVVRYRSRRDLLDMITSPEFQAAEVHKWASVERTLVAPTSSIGATPLSLIVPIALLGAGVLLTRRRSLH